MSFKEVTSLRKAGRLQDAYNMAKADLEQEQSEWTYSAMFWVLSDYGKQYIAQGQQDKAGECLDEKIYNDITKESVACDERGRCFYIVDDFGVLYRYEDGELKEIDKKAKAGGNDGMKVNVLDGLLDL